MSNTDIIFKNFKLTNEEYCELCKKYQDLCRYASWQLLRRNIKNNHTDEQEDIEQDLLIALLRAGVYYKRQTYIEECLRVLKHYAKDRFVAGIVTELEILWDNRRKHGANRQKYGEFQEKIMEAIVRRIVPEEERPDPMKPLVIDIKFEKYCKQIIWNQQRSLGRKISRERALRGGLCSLDEYEYLAAM